MLTSPKNRPTAVRAIEVYKLKVKHLKFTFRMLCYHNYIEL